MLRQGFYLNLSITALVSCTSWCSLNCESRPFLLFPEVWSAYLDFMFLRKFLAFSRWLFSVSCWLCCLSWSRSLSRLTSWICQPFPKQGKHRLSVQGWKNVSDMQILLSPGLGKKTLRGTKSVTTQALPSTHLQALLCSWNVLLSLSTSPRPQLTRASSRTCLLCFGPIVKPVLHISEASVSDNLEPVP